MHIAKLNISNLRNLVDFSIEPGDGWNLVCGPNGSGKTSVLEAMFLLSSGKSLRNSLNSSIINFGALKTTCFAKLAGENISASSLGFEYSQQKTKELRVDREKCQSLVEFAQHLPVKYLAPEKFDLLLGGPQYRRQFLDWGVFHVKHCSAKTYQQYAQCLKQINSLLKTSKTQRLKIDKEQAIDSCQSQLSLWFEKMIDLGIKIDNARATYFDAIKPYLLEFIGRWPVTAKLSFDFEYAKGWDKELSLEQAVKKTIDKSHSLGYCPVGPHRADLKITVNKYPAYQVLSRGQQKVVISALYLAQIANLDNTLGKHSIFLLDDLSAELDLDNRKLLTEQIEDLGCQVFLTAVLESDWQNILNDKSFKMFHVKHQLDKL